VHVAGRTVNDDNTRGPIDRQRGRSCRFGRGKCVRLIVDVPRTEKSENCEGKKAEKRIQVELFEQGLQFLGGGHCLSCPFRRVGKQTPRAHDQAKAMKLTPELIAQAPSALNPLKERQLDLRGTR